MKTRPDIAHVKEHQATLLRRRAHLRNRLDSTGYEGSRSAEYDKAEVAAIDAAIVALEFVA